MTDSASGEPRTHLPRPGLPDADKVPAPLDPQCIARLRELDPDGEHGVLLRVLSAYQAALGRHLDDLNDALEQGDRPRLLRVAHTLKSSSAAVGALDLSGLCAELERQARDSPRPPAEPGVEALIHEGRRVLAAVGAMLAP